MDDEKPPSQSARPKPAIWAAGRRRRLTRRSDLPRSSTTPNLDLDPKAATSSLVGNMTSTYGAMGMNAAFAYSNADTSNTSSVPATEDRKKGRGFLGVFKSKEKEKERRGSSDGPAQAQEAPAPVPEAVLESPKALRVLGHPAAKDKATDESTDRPAVNRGISAPNENELQGRFQTDSEVQDTTEAVNTKTKSGEDILKEGDPPVAATSSQNRFTNWKSTNKKALRMLDLVTRPKSSGTDAVAQPTLTPEADDGDTVRLNTSGTETLSQPIMISEDNDNDNGYHSEGSVPHRSSRPTAAKPPGRRKNRPLSRINEDSSHQEYFHGTDDPNEAELDVINEYGLEPKHAASSMGRSATAPLLPRYGLTQDDLSSSDDDAAKQIAGEGNGIDEEINRILRRGTKFLKHGRVPEMVQVKSPLQEMEMTFLNNTEEREVMDKENQRLYQEHVKWKAQLADINRRSAVPDPVFARVVEANPVDTPDHPVQNDTDSDTESEEEAVVELASVQTIRRFPPGSAKLIDIPPRKMQMTKVAPGQVKTVEIPKRHNGQQGQGKVKGIDNSTRNNGQQATALRSSLGSIVKVAPGQIKMIDTSKRDGGQVPRQVKTIDSSERSEGQQVPVLRGGLGESSPASAGSPVHSSQHAHTKQKKSKLPREESRDLVQGWIDRSSPIAQRPDSTRVDPDVLADQALDRAPAPPPKESSSTTLSPKHHCVHSGHIFRPVDLRTTPDNVAINNLGVSPYLQTPTGVKQHVRVHVACEKCGHDVEEQLLECEIPVCRLTVCYYCAVKMQEEAEGRAVSNWEQKKGGAMI